MSARAIHNLVRALAAPYPGASFSHGVKEIKALKTQMLDKFYPQNIEPGYVCEASEGFVVVKVEGVAAIKVYCDHAGEIVKGEYL